MATLSKLTPGQVLYTLSRHKMGNTTISTVAVHQVRVQSVHDDHVIASWNGNPGRQYGVRDIAKWRVSKPQTVVTVFGARRLARRDELAAQTADVAQEA